MFDCDSPIAWFLMVLTSAIFITMGFVLMLLSDIEDNLDNMTKNCTTIDGKVYCEQE